MSATLPIPIWLILVAVAGWSFWLWALTSQMNALRDLYRMYLRATHRTPDVPGKPDDTERLDEMQRRGVARIVFANGDEYLPGGAPIRAELDAALFAVPLEEWAARHPELRRP